jgi:hypothetical protein
MHSYREYNMNKFEAHLRARALANGYASVDCIPEGVAPSIVDEVITVEQCLKEVLLSDDSSDEDVCYVYRYPEPRDVREYEQAAYLQRQFLPEINIVQEAVIEKAARAQPPPSTGSFFTESYPRRKIPPVLRGSCTKLATPKTTADLKLLWTGRRSLRREGLAVSAAQYDRCVFRSQEHEAIRTHLVSLKSGVPIYPDHVYRRDRPWLAEPIATRKPSKLRKLFEDKLGKFALDEDDNLLYVDDVDEDIRFLKLRCDAYIYIYILPHMKTASHSSTPLILTINFVFQGTEGVVRD